jgi:hypothetical protein
MSTPWSYLVPLEAHNLTKAKTQNMIWWYFIIWKEPLSLTHHQVFSPKKKKKKKILGLGLGLGLTHKNK